jgi:hypothetical protein
VLKFNEPLYYEGNDLGTHFQNFQYKPYSLSVPVIIGLNYNRLDLFLRYNKGVTNKIISKERFTKEYDNVILLVIGYKFSKKKQE